MNGDVIRALKALADRDRLRIVGLLANTAATSRELAEALRLPAPAVARHLGMLAHVGLVTTEATGDGSAAYVLRLERLHELGRALDELDRSTGEVGPEPPVVAGLAAEDARVVRSFFEGERLTTIPAQERKRLAVLRYLRELCFAEDRAYPEREVNMRLALHHPDVAALRRYMVDAGLMTRAGGEYRRAPEPTER